MNNLILIGSSTGGPNHLKKILKALAADFNSTIVIAQHMGDSFIDTFVKHMDNITPFRVSLASDNLNLEESTIYIASKRCTIVEHSKNYTFKVSKSKENEYNPNINELFLSCSNFQNTVNILAIILTGIGNDGSLGIKKLCLTSAQCIAESQESAIVYGMPQRAKEVSSKVQVESLDDIIKSIQRFGT